jgi:hypothetical protein
MIELPYCWLTLQIYRFELKNAIILPLIRPFAVIPLNVTFSAGLLRQPRQQIYLAPSKGLPGPET